MAEYITKAEVKEILYNEIQSLEDYQRCVGKIDSLPTTNVIERSEYENLQNQLHHWEHEHAKRILENSDLRSKIDKAIEKIEDLEPEYDRDTYYGAINDVLEIIEKNIGEQIL